MNVLDNHVLSQRDFKKIQRLIYDLAGIALADSKQVMVHSRLAKRIRLLQMDCYAEYLEYLEAPQNSEEVIHFINALTTNKTDFFREAHHFSFLKEHLFPQVKQQAATSGEQKLRIWCSASSTGEEPYTIAMTMREFFGVDFSWDLRILASDIDTNVLHTAEQGVYDAERISQIPKELVRKYFDRESREPDADYRAKKSLRELITFRRLNLQDAKWPINIHFDVIFCRNVMIYFDAPSQQKIVNHFANYLSPSGYLILGHSESLLGVSERFSSLGDTIYQLNDETPNRVKLSAVPTCPIQLASCTQPKSAAPTVKVEIPSLNSAETSNPSNDPKKQIIVGEFFASGEPYWITTVLGSCVAVCLYDEKRRMGGMNHFMLPGDCDSPISSSSYGVHAMELLINTLMKLGADRHRLKAKLFGGGKVLQGNSGQWQVGRDNVNFAERFLKVEGIPITAQHTLLETGIHLQFHTQTAKALVRTLDRTSTEALVGPQVAERRLSAIQPSGDVTLFH